MKITIRLIISLLVIAVLVATVFSYIQVCNEKESQIGILKSRCLTISNELIESIQKIKLVNYEELQNLFERVANRERLYGIVLCDSQGSILASTSNLASLNISDVTNISELIEKDQYVFFEDTLGDIDVFISFSSFIDKQNFHGIIGTFYDLSFIDDKLIGIWQHNFIRLLTLSLLIIITTVMVVRWSIVGPIAKIAGWLKYFRMGKGTKQMEIPDGDLLGPLASEINQLTKNLTIARTNAEEEARLRIIGETTWTAERLKEQVRLELGERNLFLVSNREPYMHIKKGFKIEYIVPAGGLVTALDPVMRASGGVWIANGSGDADRETVDENNKIKVPPEEPLYTLKRVWLTKEEEQGYYYGFANEGIWPLCHITHTRPTFRLEDWIYYQKVNEKFAESILEEIKYEKDPLILIQDYHFALLPYMIKSQKPDARVAIFWHIPWPNPEAFNICPWQKEILIGLLGADLIGFHIQFHCNNFLETVDRILESIINWEQFSVERGGQITFVKPFPISVAFPSLTPDGVTDEESKKILRDEILNELGVETEFLGIGVDRIDYTKGIIERFKAIERFFEKYPEYIGKLIFIELGAPSRTHIKRYHDLIAELETTVENICWKFQSKNWKPIIFLKGHHSHQAIHRYYRICHFCMVTSLHDGMNLVAKEFVASRNDDDGVLILSQFTGASRELQDALIINPYHIEEMADAIYSALNMKKEERKERMSRLRGIIHERNIYRWAGGLVSTLNRIRVTKTVES